MTALRQRSPVFAGMLRRCRCACLPLTSLRTALRRVAVLLSLARAIARAAWALPHCSSARARPHMVGAPHVSSYTRGEDARPGQTDCPARCVTPRAQLCTNARAHAAHRTLAGGRAQRVAQPWCSSRLVLRSAPTCYSKPVTRMPPCRRMRHVLPRRDRPIAPLRRAALAPVV